MEPIISKLQEGVKYPRFERDATKTINDLVEHITKERGVYSSSIEPNPSEHNIWFNTDTNTLMIYNNHVWKDFSGSSSGWSVENALIYRNENDYPTMGNIKDKTFYILNFNSESDDGIDIPNLSDDIEFYIFFPKIPTEIHFPNSNIITNYNIIAKSFDRISLAGMSVLMHKIGITVEFNVIDDKSYTSNVDYIYNTKLEEVYMAYGQSQYHTVKCINTNNHGINQIEIKLPSNIPTSRYTIGSFATKDAVQIVYPPFKYETCAEYFSSVCIFKNPNSEERLQVISSIYSLDYISQDADRYYNPSIAVFDRFNPDNIDKICTTYYPDHINDDNCGLIIKDNWNFNIFGGISNFEAGFSIIIDNFPINKNNYFFANSIYYCNDLIINNSSDDDKIKNLIERIVKANFRFTNYDSYTFELPSNSLTYTTNYKSKYIGIPNNYMNKYDNEMLIVIANKLRDDTEIIIDNDLLLDDLGKINIFTIPENVSILKNLIDTDRFDNIAIYGTLTVDSIYDDKGLKTETYNYSINGEDNEFKYERYDTPVIA